MFVVGSLVGLSGYWLGWYAFCLLRGPAGLGITDLILPSQVGKVDGWLYRGGAPTAQQQATAQPGTNITLNQGNPTLGGAPSTAPGTVTQVIPGVGTIQYQQP